jgi:hypothetical protein
MGAPPSQLATINRVERERFSLHDETGGFPPRPIFERTGRMAKGKWAQGIKPRHFHWIIDGQLAVCERPGGYGTNHRRVRRQEEIIWIRENDFAFVVSLIPSNHNLHSYDELGMPWKHWPLAPSLDSEAALGQIYPELRNLLQAGHKLLLHGEEVGDRIAGVMAGYLRWSGMVADTAKAIIVVETIFTRQMGPTGRELVAAAGRTDGAANFTGG